MVLQAHQAAAFSFSQVKNDECILYSTIRTGFPSRDFAG
jgi:hypothetical protein